MTVKNLGAAFALLVVTLVFGFGSAAWASDPLTPNPNGATIANNGGQLSNDTGVTFENNGTIQNNSGTIDNFGTIDNNAGPPAALIQNNSGAILNNNNNATINNAGTIDNPGIIRNTGTINNTGTVTIESGGGQLTNVNSQGGSYSQTGSGSTQVDGTLSQDSISIGSGTVLKGSGAVTAGVGLTNSGTITGLGAGLILQAPITGTGNYTGTVFFANGSLATGSTPATIQGETMIFGNGNTLTLKIAQQSPNHADLVNDAINATGSVTLGGTLVVTVADLGSGKLVPQLNDSFDLINAGTFINNDFNKVELPTLASGLEWDFGPANVDGQNEYLITVGAEVPVPEPPSLVLWLAGIAGLAWRAGRRPAAADRGGSDGILG
jgi:hypothetical protein